VAELAIEAAAAERGVVAVGAPEAGSGDAVAARAQDAGLADAGLADEDNRRVRVERLEQGLDDSELGRRAPEFGGGDLLGERGSLSAKWAR
jgi:hypothetical protein